MLHVKTPRVVQAIVGGALDVAEDPLDGLQMLCPRSLHEPKGYGEHQAWPRVDEVAKAAHNAPVLRGVDLLDRVVVAQLHLHGSVGWVAAGEPAQLDDELGVGGLAKGDAGAVLVDLDPQVEGEKAQVAHLEGRLHLLLERLHLSLLGAGDHQVVYIDAYQQGIAILAPLVDSRLVRTLLEPHLLEGGVQLGVPSSGCLPQAIEGLAQAKNLVLLAGDDDSRCWWT